MVHGLHSPLTLTLMQSLSPSHSRTLVSQQLPVALLVEVIEMSPEVLLAVHCLLSACACVRRLNHQP